MASKYCFCGAKTEFVSKQPLYCSNCGQPFAKAFGAALSSSVTHSVPIVSKTRTIPHSRPMNDNEESDNYDQDEVQELANQIAASISAEDFGIVVSVPQPRGYKMSDVLDPKKQLDIGHRGTVEIGLSQSE